MRRVVFDQFGAPADVLRVEDVPPPVPGPGEVLVRLRARPINPSDLHTVHGSYGVRPKLPATPGYEGVGIVEAVGANVTGVAVGQRVIPRGVAGTWQEQVVAKAANLIPVPEGVRDEHAAQFIVNPLTAWIMIVEELGVQPGEWLLQTAAGSTLGHIVRQLARLRGFRTLDIVRRREQAEALAADGSGAAIATDAEDLVERVKAIAGADGVRAAIDAVGGETGASVVRALAPGGMLLVYGRLAREPMPLDVGPMIFGGLTVRGFWLTGWLRRTSAERREAIIAEVLGHMADGAIAPPVAATYDLADVAEAVRHAERTGRVGKVLLVG